MDAPQNQAVYVCQLCGYGYHESEGDADTGIAPGTAFADLPHDWECPACGAGKVEFRRRDLDHGRHGKG